MSEWRIGGGTNGLLFLIFALFGGKSMTSVLRPPIPCAVTPPYSREV
jgi:hypothetical protein